MYSLDVLEHFEPEHIAAGIRHISELTKNIAYLLIACHPAKKTLPDGRNAHLIVEGPEYWKPLLLENFDGELVYEEFKVGKINEIVNHTLDKYIVVFKK